MKKYFSVVLLLLCGLFLYAGQTSAAVTHVSNTLLDGEIRGVLESCTPGSGISGSLVYIPGISIMAKTDSKGSFRLLDVPPGVYRLVFEIAGQEYYKDRVKVLQRQVTHLGGIPICEECAEDSDCAPDSFCNKKAGECGGQGVCEKKPFACIKLYAPVCGCDGLTYENECMAHAAGVNVAQQGRCEPLPAECNDNADCGSTALYCSKPEGECSVQGECKAKPNICLLINDPVCGCDGKTYSNECAAAMQGVNISHNGSCHIVIQPPMPKPIPIPIDPKPKPIPIPINPGPSPMPH